VLDYAAAEAGRVALDTEQRVQLWNADVRARNEVLTDTLADVTGASLGNEPRAWWNWWYGQSSDYRPQRTLRDDVHEYWHYTHLQLTGYPGSCFAAGTPVQTQRGLQPIETIEPGDQVLAQDPTTGELGFGTVLRTTLRPGGAMVRVTIGDEDLLATEVHPFWVVGEGWKIARSLTAEDRLHALGGTTRIDEVSAAGEHDAYNLVVDRFHTYFVGRDRSLVHDVTLQAPIDAAVPGMIEE
jgi:hypothetical protein